MTNPADLRAVLGDPAGIPADRIPAYFAAMAAGADAAPAREHDRARQILGPAVRASAARSQGKSEAAA